jgi:hypothetical protein
VRHPLAATQVAASSYVIPVARLAQFDSDITVRRYPRRALGVGERELLAVCCDATSRRRSRGRS